MHRNIMQAKHLLLYTLNVALLSYSWNVKSMALDLSSYLCMAMSNRTVRPPAAIIQPVTSSTFFTILGFGAGAYTPRGRTVRQTQQYTR